MAPLLQKSTLVSIKLLDTDFKENIITIKELSEGSKKTERTPQQQSLHRAQIILGKRGRPRPKSHSFAFTGVMKCAKCNAQITATKKKKFVKSKGETETYIYYHCTKRKKNTACDAQPLKVEELEKQISDRLEGNTINPRFYELGLEVLKEMHGLETEKRQAIYENQQRNLEDTQKKLDRALGFLLPGTISEEEYKTQKSDLEKSLLAQKVKLTATEERAQNWGELAENVFHFSKAAATAFKKADDATEKDILFSLGSNHRLDQKKLFVDLHSWFNVHKNGEKTLRPEIERLELENTLSPQKQKEAFASLRPNLCTG